MKNRSDEETEPRIFNAMQVIVLDTIVTGLLLVSTLASGMAVLPAVMVSWLGGAAITFGCLALAYGIARAQEGRTEHSDDPIRAWDEDLAQDASEAALQMEAIARRGARTSKSIEDQVADWEDDARIEEIQATFALGRKPGRERRHGTMPYTGQDRRTGSR